MKKESSKKNLCKKWEKMNPSDFCGIEITVQKKFNEGTENINKLIAKTIAKTGKNYLNINWNPFF